MRIKKRNVLITKRDQAMFRLLWKWKLLTTSALARKFYPFTSIESARKRLVILEKGGYLVKIGNSSESSVFWSLTHQSFDLVKEELPSLREEGFRSEAMVHDSLCSALQLGEWLTQMPPGAELFSEQELRRLHLGSYPEWVPATDQHRSDGYWRVWLDGKPTTIALEVEISIKKDSDYYRPAHFYDRQKSIFRVVWLVDNLSCAKRIQAKLKLYCEPSHTIHNFLTRAEFERNGWQAKFCLGMDKGESVAALIDPRGPETEQKSRVSNASRIFETLMLLDSSKTACKSVPYSPRQKDQNRNRLGIQPSLNSLPSRAYVNGSVNATLEHLFNRIELIEAQLKPTLTLSPAKEMP